MSAFNCAKCGADMKFDHTDYYDFDVYICPECGHEISVPNDIYLDPDDDGCWERYGYNEELDDDGEYIDDEVIHAPYDDEE